MTSLRGVHFVDGKPETSAGAPFHGVDPLTGDILSPSYTEASAEQIERACAAAAAASAPFAATTGKQRGALLRRIAAGLATAENELVARIGKETALPEPRVRSENQRTIRQLEQFAALAEDGSWVDARIDRADRTRQPLPKPDLRRMLVGLGPVAVFGASNFPLAYSVAGGDTASALAAGCPVVVKGHPAHPGTSELVGEIVVAALHTLGLPPAAFALLHGRTPATGAAIVRHPGIAAVGFTGSHQGGRALFDLAAARPTPIPVFAEMGSMNPVFVLPQALAHRGAQIAEQLVGSALLAMGQFCTSPGMVAFAEGAGSAAFAGVLRERLAQANAGPTVHPSIRANYEKALAEVGRMPGVQHTAGKAVSAAATAVCPTLFAAGADLVLQQPRLRSEIYGPAVLAVHCRDANEMVALARSLHGHLTATVHGDGTDFAQHAALLDVLRGKVGRLIANGVPTGVEVTGAMVHGGPYPAATDARFSAVGTTSILRWVRPVCWQDWPHDQLPPELRDDNPLGLTRLVDGKRD